MPETFKYSNITWQTVSGLGLEKVHDIYWAVLEKSFSTVIFPHKSDHPV